VDRKRLEVQPWHERSPQTAALIFSKSKGPMIEHILVSNPTGDDLEFDGELVVDEHHHDIGSVKVWKTKGADSSWS
jgi:hypothetical protein